MSYKKVIKSCLALSAMSLTALTNAQVPVHINSGNPAYPFPQFLDYACGGNLGTRNAEGLTHIEMEKMIRKAYQQHANEFEYTGEEHEGIKYIYTPYKAAYDCSEGDGYALLAAAYMADKVTFDGYWMCTHDKRRVKTKRYIDCTDNAPDYEYGDFAISDAGEGGNTAADGDVDIALALYVAYKQWGEFMLDDKGNKVLDACGNPISYKQEMINVIRGLVAISTRHPEETPRRVNTGIIGLDGYQRGGDTWMEVTDWASQEENYAIIDGVPVLPEFSGDKEHHIDYNASAYFREFYDLFMSLGKEVGASYEWEAEQFRRAEASSDWLIKDLISKNDYSVPTAGWCTVSRDGSKTTYRNFNEGEDYRCPLRTISNYVWHGNPDYTWNPKNHQVEDGKNTYEYDAAIKMSKYMADPAHWNEAAGTQCYVKSDKPIPYSGPRMMGWMIDPMTGVPTDDMFSSSLSMQKGAASFAAIGAQDYDLMGQLYNCIYQIWDIKGKTPDDELISNYMSGWFRQLGLMALSGNYAAPSEMKAQPNLKVYKAIKDSVSFCHIGDTVTYEISFRNYGSVDAKDVVIVEEVPEGFSVLNISNDGVYNASKRTITWKLEKVAGFKSDNSSVGYALDLKAPNLAATIGSVSYSCKPNFGCSGRYATKASISCSNGLGSENDIYPNHSTATMQTNSLDVIGKHLTIEKSASSTSIAKGDTVTFNLAIENVELPRLTGGRKNVNIALAEKTDKGQYNIMFKLYNDAVEPYIDNGNYRVSFFKDFEDVDLACNFDLLEGTQNGSTMASNANELVFTDTEYKKGSHMFSVQFPHALATSTLYMNEMAGASGYTCEGARYPLRVIARFNDKSWKPLDFSKGFTQLGKANDNDFYYPVTPSYQDPEKVISIDKLLASACDIVDEVTETALVEEFDGYTWRTILGSSPLKDVISAHNIVISDTIPLGFEVIDMSEKYNYTPAKEGENFAGVVSANYHGLELGQKGYMTYTCVYTGSNQKTAATSGKIVADEEFNISTPLVLNLSSNPNGIENVSSEKAEGPVNVYTTNGVMLKQSVNAEKALEGLNKGIYIVGDKKQMKFQK